MKSANDKLLVDCLAKMAMNLLEAQRDGPAEVQPRTGPSEDGQLPTGRCYQHDSTGALQVQVGGEQ